MDEGRNNLTSNRTRLRLTAACYLLTILGVPLLSVNCAADPITLPTWPALIDAASRTESIREAREKLVENARGDLVLPMVRRALSLADVGQNRTWLDGRSEALEPEIKEQFALAMSDFAAANLLQSELPRLASAYRLTGDTAFRNRVIEQLEEAAGWSPLQRPGWTLYAPGNRLPADGKDGNWLATGCGVRAIGDTLEIMPEGSIPADLRERIKTLLRAEIASIVDDWQVKRPWFVRTDNPITNQWVLPTEGLIRACLILGREDHSEEYELGVSNLMKALDAHGPKGEFEEGYGYASFTVTSLLRTGHAMAVAGDRRALDHPFLRYFPTWLAHHFQPGNYVINCFDAGPSFGAAKVTRPLFSLIAFCTGNPVAQWALQYYPGGASEDLAGLAAGSLHPVGPEAAPPLFASYERATRVNWRDSWEENATGVWARGGHELDQHDHQDRGHVNLIFKGKPILIEAGTPAYHHPRMMSHYSSSLGHNVLQIGTATPESDHSDAGKQVILPGWQKAGGVAPITVERLDHEGGNVSLDLSRCYDGLQSWNRTVSWKADLLEVTDEIQLAADAAPEMLQLRWHLGTEAEVAIGAQASKHDAQWDHAKMSVESDIPLVLSQSRMPDNTLEGHDGSDDSKNGHTCLAVGTATPTKRVVIRTQVYPQP